MKIIDFEKKGNLVRFYLGDNDCFDYHGDDWDDTPYEHNAGKVYDEYIVGYKDITFPFEYTVLEPSEDWHYNCNSPYSKDDMKICAVPCIVAIEEYKDYNQYNNCFGAAIANKDSKKYYFEDFMEPDVSL